MSNSYSFDKGYLKTLKCIKYSKNEYHKLQKSLIVSKSFLSVVGFDISNYASY